MYQISSPQILLPPLLLFLFLIILPPLLINQAYLLPIFSPNPIGNDPTPLLLPPATTEYTPDETRGNVDDYDLKRLLSNYR